MRSAPARGTAVGAVVLLLCAGLGVARGDAATTPWITFHPPKAPELSLQLPNAWQPEAIGPGSQPGIKFMARNYDGFTFLAIGSHVYPNEPFNQFAASTAASGRQFYLSVWPKASYRWRVVTLTAGRAVELIVRIPGEASRPPEAVHAFTMLHNNRSYSFSFSTRPSRIGTYLPVFQRAAQSIRFRS